MKTRLPGQVVLVLQGGGALGAYQVGVYEALHEAGIEPDWVIGTSIGAINAALIAGNSPRRRLARLGAFWDRVASSSPAATALAAFGMGSLLSNFVTVTHGVPGFFVPNSAAWGTPHGVVGVEKASYYSTTPLHATLDTLVDFDSLENGRTRLTVGTVNVRTGQMRYFDSRDEKLAALHVMASGALPPAFPAVSIDGEWYWDGGIYSNTPIEAVLEDNPRRDSVVFAATMWQVEAPEPRSLFEVMARHRDIQFASRADSHIAKQKQIHHLRHVIRKLAGMVPPGRRNGAVVGELASWGCRTTMHVIRLTAPALDGEDHTKDIDFSTAGIRQRRQAGLADTRAMIERAPWNDAFDPDAGVIQHFPASR